MDVKILQYLNLMQSNKCGWLRCNLSYNLNLLYVGPLCYLHLWLCFWCGITDNYLNPNCSFTNIYLERCNDINIHPRKIHNILTCHWKYNGRINKFLTCLFTCSQWQPGLLKAQYGFQVDSEVLNPTARGRWSGWVGKCDACVARNHAFLFSGQN